MNKTVITEILEKTAEELDSFIKTVHPSDMTLNLKMPNGKPAFYCRFKDGRQVYVNQSDTKQIQELASLYVNKKLKSAAIIEKRQLEVCLAVLEKDPDKSDIDKVMESIPAVIKENAVLTELTEEGFARKWQESNGLTKRRRKNAKDDYHKYETMRGDYVGSKSEVMIADRLFQKGIPYVYEPAFNPSATIDKTDVMYDDFGNIIGYGSMDFDPWDSDTIHPDFQVLNRRTRKVYFWEHLGKMDDPDYCKRNFNRFMRIIDAGYTIGEDLLVTHEDSRHPLLPQSIDEIIDKYLK
ncbi:MAG: hypothetical protein IJ863_06495 [Spirochaetales bacterium]|nr:hypothetical protein [Spirochaetales bacterium]